MQAQGSAPPKPSSWLGRNWKWVVPVGCLSVVAAIVVFVVAIVFAVFGLIKTSDVYQYALERASSNQAVVEALGEPIEPGWYLSGSIDVQGAQGTADISIPISGPNGSGTIYASARKTAGQWDYGVLEVAIEGSSDRIDLRE